jgi:hypothetical protein
MVLMHALVIAHELREIGAHETEESSENLRLDGFICACCKVVFVGLVCAHCEGRLTACDIRLDARQRQSSAQHNTAQHEKNTRQKAPERAQARMPIVGRKHTGKSNLPKIPAAQSPLYTLSTIDPCAFVQV